MAEAQLRLAPVRERHARPSVCFDESLIATHQKEKLFANEKQQSARAALSDHEVTKKIEGYIADCKTELQKTNARLERERHTLSIAPVPSYAGDGVEFPLRDGEEYLEKKTKQLNKIISAFNGHDIPKREVLAKVERLNYKVTLKNTPKEADLRLLSSPTPATNLKPSSPSTKRTPQTFSPRGRPHARGALSPSRKDREKLRYEQALPYQKRTILFLFLGALSLFLAPLTSGVSLPIAGQAFSLAGLPFVASAASFLTSILFTLKGHAQRHALGKRAHSEISPDSTHSSPTSPPHKKRRFAPTPATMFPVTVTPTSPADLHYRTSPPTVPTLSPAPKSRREQNQNSKHLQATHVHGENQHPFRAGG
jgi:hypothetical protein